VRLAVVEGVGEMAPRADRSLLLVSVVAILADMIPHQLLVRLVLVEDLEVDVLHADGVADPFQHLLREALFQLGVLQSLFEEGILLAVLRHDAGDVEDEDELYGDEQQAQHDLAGWRREELPEEALLFVMGIESGSHAPGEDDEGAADRDGSPRGGHHCRPF
jgi:hypothetical protein